MKTIAIIGPGAMGSLFAAYLNKAGLDVTLIDHNTQRASQLNASGISIKGVRGDFNIRVPVVTDGTCLDPVDLVMVCVKAYNTTEALRQHLSIVGPETSVLSLQNGLGNIEAIADIIPKQNIIAGTTTVGANMLNPGLIHHAGTGDIIVGDAAGGRSQKAESLAGIMQSAGFKVLVSDTIMEAIWNKLFINVGINALSAILHLRNGVLINNEPTKVLMKIAVAEAVKIASEQNLKFDLDTVLSKVMDVSEKTANNRSSMLVDIQMGRQTEIDYINGAIAKLGNAPVNYTLTLLIHALEATNKQRQRQD